MKARKAAGLPEALVLYCARHDFGTFVMSKTGNLKAVMDTMGHSDVKIAMTYQHPELAIVGDAINSRHTYGTPPKQQLGKLLKRFGCPPGIRTPIC